MTLCTEFANQTECLIVLNNEYNIKLTILVLILLISMILFYLSFKIDQNDQSGLLMYIFMRYISLIFIIFSIPLFLLLNINIRLETFLILIAIIYGLILVFWIGYASLKSWEYIKNIVLSMGKHKYTFQNKKKYGEDN